MNARAGNGGGLRDRARGGGTVATRPAGEADLVAKINAMESQFLKALPRGADAAQLARDLVTMVRNTPKLAGCDPVSVLGGAMTFAQLGLRPGVPQLGHGWLLPFKGKATVVIGYQGLAELALRHPMVMGISPHVVYERDEFDVEYGLRENLVHRPHLGADRGPAIGYYVVVRIRDADPIWRFMSRADVEAHRDRFALQRDFNTGAVKGPWVDNFDEMAQKTVFRLMSKWLPKATEFVNALAADGTYRLDTSPTADVPVVSSEVIDDGGAPDGVDPVTGEIDPDPVMAERPADDWPDAFPPAG